MKALIRLLSLSAVTLMLGACASTHMTEVPEAQRVVRPDPSMALIYFVRATSFGGAIQATVYDDDAYIGTVSANTHLPYQAKPGRHMFMIVGESADFMQADLLVGKTYYAAVQPRMGVWKARFSFRPQNGQSSDAEIKEWLSSTRQVKVNEEGYKWSRENAESVQQKKAEYLPQWNSKDNQDKQILRAESGK